MPERWLTATQSRAARLWLRWLTPSSSAPAVGAGLCCGAGEVMAQKKTGQPLWGAVDQYLGGMLAPSDEHLEAALKANQKAGLPAIDVSPLQGKFLHVLVQMTQAKRVLEIG